MEANLRKTSHSQGHQEINLALENAMESLNSIRAEFGLPKMPSLPTPQTLPHPTNTHRDPSRGCDVTPRLSRPTPRGVTVTPPPVARNRATYYHDVTRTPRGDIWARLHKQATEGQQVRMADSVLKEWREQKDYESQLTELTFKPNIPSAAHIKTVGSAKQLIDQLVKPVREQSKYDKMRQEREIENCTFQPKIDNAILGKATQKRGGSSSGRSITDRLYKDSYERRKRQDAMRIAALKEEARARCKTPY